MVGGSFLVLGMLVTWVTPIWLVSLGVALGTVTLGLLYLLAYFTFPRLAAAAVAGVREGILLPIFYLAIFLTAFAAVGVLLVPEIPYPAIVGAASRLATVGPVDYEIVIPPATHEAELSGFDVRLVELASFAAESDQPLTLMTNVSSGLGQTLGMRLVPDVASTWFKPFAQEWEKAPRDRTPSDAMTDWHATNVNATPVTLKIHAVTDVEFPEVWIVPWTALSLVGLVAVYMLIRLMMPKVAAIALTTARESMAQPLFYVALAIGSIALVAYIFIPYNTFGEDVKMLKDSGLTSIMVLSIIVAVWSASVSVSEEVEGRTALTVLSKPVTRRQFILGKFLGVLGPVVVLFVVLGFLFLVTVSFKVVYDSREMAKTEPGWQLCYVEMIRIVPGLFLAFLETVVLSAISVAISTRLPMLANLLVCASIYVLGHLVPMLVNSSVGKFEIVRFVGQFLATVLPVLDHYNIQAAVAAGAVVPMSYLAMATLYCVVYSTIAMLLGLAMFEDRDLA